MAVRTDLGGEELIYGNNNNDAFPLSFLQKSSAPSRQTYFLSSNIRYNFALPKVINGI
jgi:hypothetical protein